MNLDLVSEFLTPETYVPGDITLPVISLASGAGPWWWPLLALGALSLKVSILATTKKDFRLCLCPPTFVALKLTPFRAIRRALAFLLSLFPFSLGSS